MADVGEQPPGSVPVNAGDALPRTLGRQLHGALLMTSLLLVAVLVALQLYPHVAAGIGAVLDAMPRALLIAVVLVALPAVTLCLLVRRRLLDPLRRRLDAAPPPPAAVPDGEALSPVGGTASPVPERSLPPCDGGWCRLLFQDARDPVLIVDPASERVLDANQAAAQLLVYQREALAGLRLEELCPDALPALRGLLRRVQRDRSGWATDLTCNNSLGDALQLEIKAALVSRDGSDVVLATVSRLGKPSEQSVNFAQLAYQDALTGLPNRVLLRDRLEMALARSQRTAGRGAVLVLDTDDFKTVNDSLGHSAGDRLLQELAGRLTRVLHEDDTLARLGGDEFVVLPAQLHQRTPAVLEHALAVVDQLRSALDRPFLLEGHEFHVTLSVGVAVFPDDGDSVDDLLRRADSAMYQAKANGRDGIHFYAPELEEGMARRLTLGAALRRALANEEFVLEFQPQIDLADGRMIGCEALVRWDRPGHGRVPPLEFLPLMEEMGLMSELGFWVLDHACQRWRQGRDSGQIGAELRMAVNVSAGQFANPAFVQMVRSVLEENHMPGGNLELEITEQALVSDLQGAADKITALQTLGVSFAIDDFGTGYSSLAYLQQLPVDCLKIDRGFVRLIGEGGRGAGLVDVIISIGRRLKLRVIAEGVEHPGQTDYLTAQGCDVGQGWLFGKPVPWEQLLDRRPAGPSGGD